MKAGLILKHFLLFQNPKTLCFRCHCVKIAPTEVFWGRRVIDFIALRIEPLFSNRV